MLLDQVEVILDFFRNWSLPNLLYLDCIQIILSSITAELFVPDVQVQG